MYENDSYVIHEGEERDYGIFEGDDGVEFELDVIVYFDHDDNKYAVLANLSELEDEPEEGAEAHIYIMQVVPDGEDEKFVTVEDEKLFADLCKIVEECLKEGPGEE